MSAQQIKSVYLPRGSCYVGRIAFRDQLDWIGTAWVLAAKVDLPRHSGPNLTRRKMEAFAAANVSAPSRTDIYCEIVYGFVQRGCHDIRHSRIERRTKRRHDLHQSRRCRRQSSRTGAFGLASKMSPMLLDTSSTLWTSIGFHRLHTRQRRRLRCRACCGLCT